MPETTEESELHNGHQPQAEPEPESKAESQPESKTEPGPENKPEEALKLEPVVTGADPNTKEEDKESSIQSNDAATPSSTDQNARPQLRKDEGNRTFTMRELLTEFKSDEEEVGSPYSRESTQRQSNQNSAAMELVSSVTGADEEGQSRQRVLVYAAKRYAAALEKNPEDYDALYNWALVLQESADNVSPDSTSPSKDDLLEEACKKYDDATRLCPTLHDAFYNWAIAISDRAKMRGRTKEAEELWEQATKNYEKAVQLNWNSPQALNNWGLALQELSAIVSAREKQKIVKTAISKFREAIRLQFDFHRAIYNLGTVLVYSSALKLVHSMLPLPHLKDGYLTAPPFGNTFPPHSDWKRTEFFLNQEALQQVIKVEQKQVSRSLSGRIVDAGNTDKKAIRVDIPDIISVSASADLTLPPGAGLCINTTSGQVFLVADSWESLDGWLDALHLVYTIYARGKTDVLAGIIAT
ncbi:hypothetical protein E1A91_D03G097500v1 [Gossypium mustelinum]|uniref:PH domain-containing protein n=1 Tax=Gossypium mustelinum TaxID=34275 RepID=A0A5D2VM75_GOSMU|nr:hypothetical protein E1A91_D03G097500v1 [Gossypium mustelinum]